MKHSTLIIALTALLLSFGSVFAQPFGPPDQPGPGAEPFGGPHWGMGEGRNMGEADECCGMDDRWDDLKLSDEQRTKLDKLRLEQQTKMMDWRNEMATAHTQLQKLIIADKADEKSVNDAAAKLGKLHEQKARLMATHLRQVRELLTEEQRLVFDRMVLAGPMGKGMRGNHPGSGMGPMGRRCW
jgi:Spy/CpxP family protein refolding chaperone